MSTTRASLNPSAHLVVAFPSVSPTHPAEVKSSRAPDRAEFSGESAGDLGTSGLLRGLEQTWSAPSPAVASPAGLRRNPAQGQGATSATAQSTCIQTRMRTPQASSRSGASCTTAWKLSYPSPKSTPKATPLGALAPTSRHLPLDPLFSPSSGKTERLWAQPAAWQGLLPSGPPGPLPQKPSPAIAGQRAAQEPDDEPAPMKPERRPPLPDTRFPGDLKAFVDLAKTGEDEEIETLPGANRPKSGSVSRSGFGDKECALAPKEKKSEKEKEREGKAPLPAQRLLLISVKPSKAAKKPSGPTTASRVEVVKKFNQMREQPEVPLRWEPQATSGLETEGQAPPSRTCRSCYQAFAGSHCPRCASVSQPVSATRTEFF